MKKKNFEDKVKSMKFSEIMQAMITGLKHPKTIVKMETYGNMVGNICYGCAATNTILRLGNVKELTSLINTTQGRADLVNCEVMYFLDVFELAIDCLRKGEANSYIGFAKQLDIAQIPEEFIKDINRLPLLMTNQYEEYLNDYQRVCTKIKKAGY